MSCSESLPFDRESIVNFPELTELAHKLIDPNQSFSCSEDETLGGELDVVLSTPMAVQTNKQFPKHEDSGPWIDGKILFPDTLSPKSPNTSVSTNDSIDSCSTSTQTSLTLSPSLDLLLSPVTVSHSPQLNTTYPMSSSRISARRTLSFSPKSRSPFQSEYSNNAVDFNSYLSDLDSQWNDVKKKLFKLSSSPKSFSFEGLSN
ncbi:hypothetical protein RCL1_007108 [Eukaryota sp. TZLM3-RCL]